MLERLLDRVQQTQYGSGAMTSPVQVAFEGVRGLTSATLTVARGEAPVCMISGGVIYWCFGYADVQAQPEDLTRLVAEYAF